MKSLIITDLINSMLINLSYLQVLMYNIFNYCTLTLVNTIKIVYRLAMSNKIQSQIWRRPKFSLNLYHIIIIKLHNRNLHVGELGFKLSQREVYSMLHKNLWLKKAFSSIQYELWVWFEKQGSRCVASLLWYWQSVPQLNATAHKTVIISLATASAIETTQ